MNPIRLLAVLAAALLLSTPALAKPERYKFDKAHTAILFFISHVGFSNMVGRAHDFDGTFTFDEVNPEKSSVDVMVDPRSIDTGHAGLNKELQDERFFNSAKYPGIHFVSQEVKVTGDHRATVTGDLTMLGVTKPFALDVTFNKAGPFPMTQEYKAGFTATGSLKRSDYGMNFGLPAVGDVVQLHIETEASKIVTAPPATPSRPKH